MCRRSRREHCLAARAAAADPFGAMVRGVHRLQWLRERTVKASTLAHCIAGWSEKETTRKMHLDARFGSGMRIKVKWPQLQTRALAGKHAARGNSAILINDIVRLANVILTGLLISSPLHSNGSSILAKAVVPVVSSAADLEKRAILGRGKESLVITQQRSILIELDRVDRWPHVFICPLLFYSPNSHSTAHAWKAALSITVRTTEVYRGNSLFQNYPSPHDRGLLQWSNSSLDRCARTNTRPIGDSCDTERHSVRQKQLPAPG